jgi:hypothetical protein
MARKPTKNLDEAPTSNFRRLEGGGVEITLPDFATFVESAEFQPMGKRDFHEALGVFVVEYTVLEAAMYTACGKMVGMSKPHQAALRHALPDGKLFDLMEAVCANSTPADEHMLKIISRLRFCRDARNTVLHSLLLPSGGGKDMKRLKVKRDGKTKAVSWKVEDIDPSQLLRYAHFFRYYMVVLTVLFPDENDGEQVLMLP